MPRSPERLSTAPLSTDDRVILTGAASAELVGGEASEPGIAAAARAAVAAVEPPAHAPPNAPPATESGWPMAVTPGPVTVRSLPGGHGSSPQVSGVPPTDRIAHRRRRSQLVRRCIAAGVLAIPISGAATALYIHIDRGRSEAAEAAVPAAASGAAAAAPASGVSTAEPVPGKDRPAMAEGEARGSAASGRAAGAEVAGEAARSGTAPAAVPPPPAGAPRATARPARPSWARGRSDVSEDIYEDEEDIYGVPSGGRGVRPGGRVPAPAQPASPRRGKDAKGPPRF
ncbi:hypothetical protein [Sorangium sp. So ce388]|uniref:hypothetical protein n=1 Tax=Sorangium sp. So ce388 TaxID=3133309 RepID=UPI003F5B16AA